jgi:hypothetical protein
MQGNVPTTNWHVEVMGMDGLGPTFSQPVQKISGLFDLWLLKYCGGT